MMKAFSTRAIMIDEADGSFYFMGDSAGVSAGTSTSVSYGEAGTQGMLF